jgi:cellulose biosynthesis protein BcsQ
MVWTRYRSFTKLAQELSDAAEKQLGLEALKTSLAMRVSYTEALGSGLTGAEIQDQNAKIETRYLAAEVMSLLRKKS